MFYILHKYLEVTTNSSDETFYADNYCLIQSLSAMCLSPPILLIEQIHSLDIVAEYSRSVQAVGTMDHFVQPTLALALVLSHYLELFEPVELHLSFDMVPGEDIVPRTITFRNCPCLIEIW